jgi:uncharacterized protein (DUF433 family)
MDRISINSQIHFGKPCIAGTRITVQSILELLYEGLSFKEIIQDYRKAGYKPIYYKIAEYCNMPKSN